MFEHFGVKDIWVTVKKNKVLILSVALISGLIFGAFTFKKVLSVIKSGHSEGEFIYASSASYYIQPALENIECENVDANFYRSLPDDYVALFNTDACATFVYNKLTQKYSKEYIMKNSDFTPDESNETSVFQAIKNIYKAQRQKGTMVVNIYALAYDTDFSRHILSVCREYLKDNIQPQIKIAQAKFSGEAIKVLTSPDQIISENSSQNDTVVTKSSSGTKNVLKIVIKTGVFPVAVILVCLIFVLLLIAAANPTLNRKSDFCEYNIPIIGEVNE